MLAAILDQLAPLLVDKFSSPFSVCQLSDLLLADSFPASGGKGVAGWLHKIQPRPRKLSIAMASSPLSRARR